jgi:hypothetical protein
MKDKAHVLIDRYAQEKDDLIYKKDKAFQRGISFSEMRYLIGGGGSVAGMQVITMTRAHSHDN